MVFDFLRATDTHTRSSLLMSAFAECFLTRKSNHHSREMSLQRMFALWSIFEEDCKFLRIIGGSSNV